MDIRVTLYSILRSTALICKDVDLLCNLRLFDQGRYLSTKSILSLPIATDDDCLYVMKLSTIDP